MQPFRFIHSADLHLDSPFVGVKSISGDLQEQLQDSTFRAFERIVDACLHYQVDFLTIGGDLYDGADRSLRAQVFFREQMKRLEHAGIQVFVIHGNHDHLGGKLSQLNWPTNVHVFPSGSVTSSSVYKNQQEIARIYGISYPKQSVTDRYVLQYKKEMDAPYAIGLLHTNVGNLSDHVNYAPATVEELVQSGMDFWGLGHIHIPRIIREQHPVIVYPGNPQGRHIRETGERGCFLVEVDTLGESTLTFLPTQLIRWAELEVELFEDEQEAELLERMLSRIHLLTRESQVSWIIRIRITGASSLHAALQVQDYTKQLQESLQTMLEIGFHSIWIESITVMTRPLFDIESLRAQPNFVGDFLSMRERFETSPEAMDQLRESLRELFGVGRALPELTDEELKDMLRRSELLGLQMLLELEG